MKCKILLTGKNQAVIDDFFYNSSEDVECQSTSTLTEDIMSHIKYFEPDFFVYCINGERKENYAKIGTMLHKLEIKGIPVVVVGHKEECDNLQKIITNHISFMFIQPVTISLMEESLFAYLEQKQQLAMEEQRRKEEQMEKERQRQEELQQKQAVTEEKNRRKHVLVIDDDVRILKLIKNYLSEKYDVATAVSGKVALKFLENKQTDMILLDYEMPEQNGAEVLEQIRSNEKSKHLPVVFLTGINDGKKIQQVLALKPQGYLLKPVDKAKILKKIESVLK